MAGEKQHAREVTERFLQEKDRVVTRRGKDKVTAEQFASVVGMKPTNLVRLRSGSNYVTIDACYRLCKHYGTDPSWLLMGEGPKGNPESKLELLITKWDGIISKLDKPVKPAKRILKIKSK